MGERKIFCPLTFFNQNNLEIKENMRIFASDKIKNTKYYV